MYGTGRNNNKHNVQKQLEDIIVEHYQYQIFIPGGNKTALVFGIDGLKDDIDRRKIIQDKIIALHEDDTDGEVEQVGFVNVDKSSPQLVMTGGEFCGNATRTAVAYYLNNCEGEIEIAVSGTSKSLLAGISSSGTVWSYMPVFEDLSSSIIYVRGGLYWVMIEGISHLIVPQLQSVPYLSKILECENSNDQKKIALDLLSKTINNNSLPHSNSYGIIFLENIADILKMHPFVYIKTAETANYETGCGSGAICIGLVSSMLFNKNINIPLLQPSGKIINAEVEYYEDNKVKAKISGVVECKEKLVMEC